MLPGVRESFEHGLALDNENHLLTVFLSIDKDPELKNWRNRVTAWRQGSPIIHTEVYFPKSRDSFTITADQPAQWIKDRTMQRDWIVFAHEVTPRQRDRAHELFSEHEGRHFDNFGFACGLFCMSPAFVSSEETMCSRIVAEVYSHPDVGIISPDEIDPRVATPAELYDLLKPPRSKRWRLPVKAERSFEKGSPAH